MFERQTEDLYGLLADPDTFSHRFLLLVGRGDLETDEGIALVIGVERADDESLTTLTSSGRV